MKTNKTLKITYNAVFIVITLILGYLGRLSILPVFPFLKLDFSDIPVFLATIISDVPSGILVLLVSSSFRMFLFSSAGFAGFIVRLTSLIIVFSLGLSNKFKNKFFKISNLIFGAFVCLIIKLIINYFLWINLFFIPDEILKKFMFPVIIPYNVAKLLITISAALYLKKPMEKLFKISKNNF